MVSDFNELDLMQARVKSIPTDWKFMPVSKAFKIRNEFRKPISDDIRSTQQGIYPYYGPTKIQDYIDTYEQDGSFALIGEDGDHFLKYKNLPMTQLVDGKCTVNNHAHIIEGTELATREWFYYYFMHKDIFSYLSRQGAGRYKLNKASLEKIGLLVPPIQEQKKIAEILSTWEKAIETVEKLVANSQQQKKALMQQLLTGQKRLLDDNGVKFGDEWAKGKLSDLATISKGKALSSKNVKNGNYPVIAGGKTSPYCHNDFTHENVVTISASGAYAGYVAYHSSKIWASDCSVITEKGNSDINFIFQLLSHLQSTIYSLQSGGAQPHVYPKDLEILEIKIPSKKEQKKIAQVLTLADREIDLYQQQLDKLKLEKKSLIQQLLTGQKRVKID